MAGRNNDIVQYLWGARDAVAETRRRHLRVQELEARCTTITAKMNGMPGGGGDRHSLEQAYLALAEERVAELEAIKEETRKHHDIERLINSLPTLEHRAVLRHRYLRGLDWDAVQREMARDRIVYCDRQIFRLHGEALNEVRRILKEGGANSGVPTETSSEVLHRPTDRAGEA